MQCAILAGGLATRMRPLTTTIPKALLPVAGQPFAHWQLRWLAAQGVSEVVYCIAYLGEQIRAFVGDGAAWGLRVSYADEGPVLRGTAGALADAVRAGALGDRFLVLYGDSYLSLSVPSLWRSFERSGQPMLLSVFRNDGAFDKSNVRFIDGRVELYDKHVADPVAAGMHHIDYGMSALHGPSLLAEVAACAADPTDPTGSADLASVQHRFSVQGRLAGFEVRERFYEVGSPAGLAELEAHLGGGA